MPKQPSILKELWEEFVKFIELLVWIPRSIFSSAKKQTKKVKKKQEAKYEAFETVRVDAGSLEKWEDDLLSTDSKIGIIVGARGKGKTAIGVKLLENIHAKTKRKCYVLGFKEMPSWIHVVEDVEDIKNNAFVLIDEGGVLFSSRKSMTKANQFLSDLILVARHKSLSIIFISQNSANLDVNILRQADYLILKPSSLLQLDFERKKIKKIYEDIQDGFKAYKHKGIAYIYNDEFRGFVKNPLPSFWSSKISKSFR